MGHDNSNLPPGITQDHPIWNDEPRFKECPECKNLVSYGHCGNCNNEGEIEMDADELRDYLDEKNEPDDL